MPNDSQPTEVELRILQVLWEAGPSTARFVHDRIHKAEGKNYSTTVKMLAVMLEKLWVRRNDSVRPQTFAAAVTRKTTERSLVKDLITKAFDGSAARLAMQALSSGKTSPEDLQEIRNLLNRLEGKP